MKFWDSSAIVALCIIEPHTRKVVEILKGDETMAVWWGTQLECLSALSRRIREGMIERSDAGGFERALASLATAWNEVRPRDSVRERARRILLLHPLKAPDSLQLAAALIWSKENPFGLEFVSLDRRLRDCAEKEGFTVLPDSLPQ
jgi:uncharacterized protein